MHLLQAYPPGGYAWRRVRLEAVGFWRVCLEEVGFSHRGHLMYDGTSLHEVTPLLLAPSIKTSPSSKTSPHIETSPYKKLGPSIGGHPQLPVANKSAPRSPIRAHPR